MAKRTGGPAPSAQPPPTQGAPLRPGRNGAVSHALFPEILNPKKRGFLAAYARCRLLTAAAKLAKCDISSHYDWKRTDPAYVEAFERAQAMVADLHEEEATRRALGWDETHYASDGTPYTVRKQSDTLLIFRLKALKPEVYRESYKSQHQEISELLKAVLLELATVRDGQQPATPVLEAEFQPWTPASALPPLPAPDEPDEPMPWHKEPTPW